MAAVKFLTGGAVVGQGGVARQLVLSPLRVSGTPAALYGYPQRQLSWVVAAGPYLVMATVGYADGRPRGRVPSDPYAYQEMTSLARGVAVPIAAPLGGTPASNPNWGAHGTWMESLIAGHGHGRGARNGILGVAPQAKILSIRVITDRTDPSFGAYHHQPEWRVQRELAKAIRFAVRRGAQVISMSLGYSAWSVGGPAALQLALSHRVVVVASSRDEGTKHNP